MIEQYNAYLDVLDTLCKKLQELTQLAQDKAAAVRGDDLLALDHIMRQEQALSLSFRGLEQKKETLSRQLGLEAVPLSATVSHFPAALHLQAKNSVETLQRQYQVYSSAAKATRTTLECNLHEIEKFLASKEQKTSAVVGYAPPPVEPPQAMKSDFRA